MSEKVIFSFIHRFLSSHWQEMLINRFLFLWNLIFFVFFLLPLLPIHPFILLCIHSPQQQRQQQRTIQNITMFNFLAFRAYNFLYDLRWLWGKIPSIVGLFLFISISYVCIWVNIPVAVSVPVPVPRKMNGKSFISFHSFLCKYFMYRILISSGARFTSYNVCPVLKAFGIQDIRFAYQLSVQNVDKIELMSISAVMSDENNSIEFLPLPSIYFILFFVHLYEFGIRRDRRRVIKLSYVIHSHVHTGIALGNSWCDCPSLQLLTVLECFN